MSGLKFIKAETLSFSELLELAERNGPEAMEKANKKHLRAKTTARYLYNEELAVRYKYGEHIRDNKAAFLAEISDPYWAGRTYGLKRSNALRIACVRGCGFAEGPMAETAIVIANALSVLFDADPPVPASEVPKRLRVGGIKALLDIYRAKKRERSVTAVPLSQTRRDNYCYLTKEIVESEPEDFSDLIDYEDTLASADDASRENQAELSVAPVSPAASQADDLPKRDRHVKYPDGTKGLKSTDILNPPEIFQELMSLRRGEGRWLYVESVENGESIYRRLEGKICQRNQ